MKFLPLVWRNIWRRKVRTTFTLLSIFIAFLLFGILMTIRNAFSLGVEIAGLDRLIADPQGQPDHAAARLVPGRLQRCPASRLVDAQHVVRRRLSGPGRTSSRNIAVEPEPYLKIVPGVQGAARAGEGLARRSPGRDRREGPREAIRLEDRRPRAASGHDLAARRAATSGSSTSSASTTATDGVDKTQFFFRYDYLDENRTHRRRATGRLVHRQDRRSRRRPVEMSRTFDAMFANSSAETKTTTEKGFVEGFAKQIGDIGAIMIAIPRGGAVHDSAGRRPTRWRSRCASAPASWRC